MKPRTKALVAMATGSALGLGGLAALAVPAGAGDAPSLPEIGAEELVESALTAEPPALAGTVESHNQLGLPDLPGLGLADFESAQVWHDGDERARLAVSDGTAEKTVVRDTSEAWTYDSEQNTATRYPLPEDGPEHKAGDGSPHDRSDADPATAATEIIGTLRESSTLSVDGTAQVADRPAYELVLTPEPAQRTVLREVKIAIDSETRLPLRFEVLANGSPDPVVSIGFSDLDIGAQDEELFTFTPPEGAEVIEHDVREHTEDGSTDQHDSPGAQVTDEMTVVGDGWDAVLVGTMPEGALSGRSTEQRDEAGGNTDPRALLDQAGERVSGEFGEGTLISTRAGHAVITDDGRFALGAVPQQVAIEALDEQ